MDAALAAPLVVLPLADVLHAIGPLEGAKALPHVHLVLPLVLLLVRPHIHPSSMHEPIHPVPTVLPAVIHSEPPLSVELVPLPLTLVGVAVGKLVEAGALLDSFVVLPLIKTAVLPGLLPLAMRLVFLPVSFVFLALIVDENSKTVGKIILPLAFILAAILVDELALALRHVLPPLSLVLRPIGPLLLALALPLVIADIAIVDRPILELDSRVLAFVGGVVFDGLELAEPVEFREGGVVLAAEEKAGGCALLIGGLSEIFGPHVGSNGHFLGGMAAALAIGSHPPYFINNSNRMSQFQPFREE